MHSSTPPSLYSCSSLSKIELYGQGHHVHEARVVKINEALQQIVIIKDIKPMRALSHFHISNDLEGFHTLVPITYKKINHQHVIEHLVQPNEHCEVISKRFRTSHIHLGFKTSNDLSFLLKIMLHVYFPFAHFLLLSLYSFCSVVQRG